MPVTKRYTHPPLDALREQTFTIHDVAVNHDLYPGQSCTPEYDMWVNMLHRCYNGQHKAYPHYGGRGIRVSDDWKCFQTFLSDMGDRPSSKHSIERIDNNGHYSKQNCCYALRKTQQNNRRTNVKITFNGYTRNLSEWATILNVTPDTLRMRRRNGWTLLKMLTTPALHGPKKKETSDVPKKPRKNRRSKVSDEVLRCAQIEVCPSAT